VLAILRRQLAARGDKLGELAKLRSDLEAHIDRFERWLDRAGGRWTPAVCCDPGASSHN
jgi:hypothetical protein